MTTIIICSKCNNFFLSSGHRDDLPLDVKLPDGTWLKDIPHFEGLRKINSLNVDGRIINHLDDTCMKCLRRASEKRVIEKEKIKID